MTTLKIILCVISAMITITSIACAVYIERDYRRVKREYEEMGETNEWLKH